MLPGTKYTVEDIVRLLRRRKALVIACVVAGFVAGGAVETRQPKRFKSETLIMVVPQRIPDSYVRTTVTTRIEDHLQSVGQQILSRPRLERIIADFNLYAEERRVLPMEEVVARMRDDIHVTVERGDLLRVSYTSREAQTAQKVTERLAALFIEENLRDRETLAEDTNRFLETQLQDAKRRLVEQEGKLEAYNKRYGGQLPSQTAANLDQIHNAQARAQAIGEAIDRGRERRLALARELADLEAADTAPQPAQTAPVADEAHGGTPAQRLEAAQARLRQLEERAKPDHPDVRALKRTIRDLQAEVRAASAASATAPPPAPTAADRQRQRRAGDLRNEIAALDRELADEREQQQRLRGAAATYQARVDAVPAREAELVQLTRDYTALQNAYQGLVAKQEEAKIAANLERRNLGDEFKILDPARVSQRSITPGTIVFVGAGGLAGLACGLLLVAFVEYRDDSFRREEQVTRVLSLPVLAVVPVMSARQAAEPWWQRLPAASWWRRG